MKAGQPRGAPMRRLLLVLVMPLALAAAADAARAAAGGERCYPPNSAQLAKALSGFWPHGVKVGGACGGDCTTVSFRGAALLSSRGPVSSICLEALPAEDRQKDRRCHSMVYGSRLTVDRPRQAKEAVSFAYVKTLADIDACRPLGTAKAEAGHAARKLSVRHNVEIAVDEPVRRPEAAVAGGSE